MTVYDYKMKIFERMGCRDHFEFCKQSDVHRAFWMLLNSFWTRYDDGNIDNNGNVDEFESSVHTEGLALVCKVREGYYHVYVCTPHWDSEKAIEHARKLLDEVPADTLVVAEAGCIITDASNRLEETE